LTRNFKDDMSDTTTQRLHNQLEKAKKGEKTSEQWTVYPRGIPTTVQVAGSAIRVEGGRTAILFEAGLPDNNEIDHSSVRSVEMLRHLPLAVCQFELTGKMMYQNPEAYSLFGTPDEDHDNFLSRFVDRETGKNILTKVQEGNDYTTETELYTKMGPLWFSVSVRRAKDPITSDFTILWNARDITDIIQARKEKDRASLKSEFYAVIAHEIRTPLHQIIGFMDLLELTELTTAQIETIKVIQNSTSLLMCIINDLLDWTKLENGKLRLENISFTLEDLLHGCVEAVEVDVERKNLTMCKVFANATSFTLMGDPNRLRQIILNLLSNAIKFTESGSITLRVTTVASNDPSKQRLRFQIADTGIGIDPVHQKMLFQKYQQGNSSIARNYGGTGLGLAICKSLVEAMGGSIDLVSELDKGTTVTVEIPFGLPVEELEEKQAPIHVSPAPLVGLHILIAEDNKVNQKMLSSMLKRIGHTVTVAENGQRAVDEVRLHHFDMVLMDIQMPVLDGIDATKQIRSLKSDVPIVGLTASFQPSEMEYYRSIGMQSCLGKPLRLNELTQAIEMYVKCDRVSPKNIDPSSEVAICVCNSSAQCTRTVSSKRLRCWLE